MLKAVVLYQFDNGSFNVTFRMHRRHGVLSLRGWVAYVNNMASVRSSPQVSLIIAHSLCSVCVLRTDEPVPSTTTNFISSVNNC